MSIRSAAPADWNRLVDRMQWFQLTLASTPEGRAAVTRMIDDPCPTVREWSTTNALAWDPAIALPALRRQIEADGPRTFTAKVVLHEYEAGRLNTSWTPKGRPPVELR
ncbi:MAG: hypothetical protein NTV23_02480 [Propionibacteriales bacterium]|nr:hypothetical protein [Propionibacteriales bacterium]